MMNNYSKDKPKGTAKKSPAKKTPAKKSKK
jgi:hypothetical protein